MKQYQNNLHQNNLQQSNLQQKNQNDPQEAVEITSYDLCDCENCGLYGCRRILRTLPTTKTKIAVVTDMFHSNANRVKNIFYGRAGSIFEKALHDAGLGFSDCFLTATVACVPKGFREPKASEVKCCKNRLFHELKSIKELKVIVAVGAIAMKLLLPHKRSIYKERGNVVWSDDFGCYVIPVMHPSNVVRTPSMYKEFAKDIQKAAEIAFGDVSLVIHDGNIQYQLIDNEELLDALIVRLDELGETPIALDVENTSTGKLICIGMSWRKNTAVVVTKDVLDNPQLVERLSNALINKNLLGHNFKHDLKTLWHNGFSQQIRTFADTMYQSYILDERIYSDVTRRGVHGLKYLIREYLNIGDYNQKIINYYEAMENCPNVYDIYEYNAKDAAYTLMLYELFEQQLDETAKWILNEIMYPVSDVLTRMEYLGVYVDLDYVNALDKELDVELDNLKKEMYELVGKEFNPNSPKQLQQLLYQDLRLPINGTTSTNKEALNALVDEHPLIPLLLKYRKESKFHTTYIKGIKKFVDEQQRVHTNFNMAVTATGRLSSSSPNLQNITRGPRARNIFAATPGWILIDGDLSQAEVRMWCWISKDKALHEAIHSGLDMHIATACLMYGCKPEDVTKAMRTSAKRITFGTIYQMTPQGLVTALAADKIYISVQEAEELQRKFFNAYKQGYQWIEDTKLDVLKTHVVTSPYGRKRHFELITPHNKAEVQRQAVNFPIQSGASDVTLLAIKRLNKSIQAGEFGRTRLLLTVHDSIVAETLEHDRIHELAKLFKEKMEAPVLDGWVKFEAEVCIGTPWGATEPIA